jgi:hypothetical protein
MANDILREYGAPVPLSIKMSGLPNSTALVGRASQFVTNTVTKAQDARIFVKATLGTNPSGYRGVYVYGLAGDASGVNPCRTDGASGVDSAITVGAAELLGVLPTPPSPSTGQVLMGAFLYKDLPTEWGIAVVNDTGVSLQAGSGHYVRYMLENPEVQ